MTAPSLSDYLNSINQNKTSLIVDGDTEKAYPPFIVNKCLSGFIDTILYANEMNINHFLDKKLQYDFLLYSVRSRKRFSPWLKKEKFDELELIKKYYGYSNEKAKIALSMLNEKQIDYIKTKMNVGGN